MRRILFAWLGMTDLRSAKEGKPGELGPIGQVVSTGDFAGIVLLNNYGKEHDAEGYVEWLKQRSRAPVDLVPIKLASPTDFAAIYVAARDQVEKVMKETRGPLHPVFHLSPGTPAMAAVWIMLGKGRFPEAELIQSSRERGVERVEMPFNISAEFIPDVAKAADQRLAMMCEGFHSESTEFGSIVHRCAAMKTIVAQANMVAARNVPVLIEGETGTGKELLARAIHKESERKSGPFVAVNCGAIPRDLFEAEFFGYKKGAFTGAESEHAGYFEQADGGTLFLDELGELPPDAQVKVLRVLNDGRVRRLSESKERPVDVRIIAATNRDLLQEVADGRFRSDLFYRLAVAMLKLPPLREREGDLALLIESMLKKVNEELAAGPNYKNKKFSANAKNLMLGHRWPGNAREMFNTIMRICVWCPGATIQEEDVRQALLPRSSGGEDDILSKSLGDGFKLPEIQDFLTSHYIRRALKEAGGNKTKAASLLGLANYQTLSNWMSKYGIEE